MYLCSHPFSQAIQMSYFFEQLGGSSFILARSFKTASCSDFLLLPKLAISDLCITESGTCTLGLTTARSVFFIFSFPLFPLVLSCTCSYSFHFLLGCQEIAEEFRSQEIDGQALLLLKEEHLMSAMNIKLGPALKICAKINVLKET